jgi:hypothetical protein
MTKPKTASPPTPITTPSTPSTPYEPPAYHPDAGKKALLALTADLDALAEGDFVTIKLDVEAATYAALSVAGFLAAPEVHARFASLPKKEFDLLCVDGFQPACFATLYALGEARAAGALETEVKVPAAIVTEAEEVEKRMQAVCEYLFGDDPELIPELDRLRPGTGSRDVANDLLGYARLYDLRAAVVMTDKKNYRPGDAEKARELAGKIIQGLSAAMTPRARAAYDRYVRAWTLLSRRYEEVRPAGLWLYRKDPKGEQRFPSLFAAARPRVGRPRKAGAAGEGGEAKAEEAKTAGEAKEEAPKK